MAGFDIGMYREMFAEEAEELFETLDNVLLEAEENGELDDEQMSSLFRAMHTIKGSGSSVELKYLSKFAHKTEDFMDQLRNHKIAYQPQMASLMIDCTDTLKELLELDMNDEVTDEIFDEKTSELMRILDIYLNGGTPDGAAPAPESSTAETPAEENSSTPEENFGIFNNSNYSESNDYGFFKEKDGGASASSSGGSAGIDSSKDYGFFCETNQAAATPAPAAAPQQEKIEKPATPPPSAAKQDTPAPAAATPAPTPAAKAAGAKDTPVKKAPAKKASSASSASNTIRVNLTKIDALMNNVGELVITNAMLSQFALGISDQKVQDAILERLELLTRHIRELQESIMSIRMVPMENIYSKFPKLIRDISKKLGKKVEFKHYGDNVEIDKAMIEGLTDPLMHIIRNSMDHGLETPDERKAAGKNESGTVAIVAEQSNGQIIISIKDDGKGIDVSKVTAKALDRGVITEDKLSSMTDEDKAMLIFEAGLSTADAITDLSGRGVGMDVVKTNINKLGGVVRIETKVGVGTTIIFVLPLTLAILDGLDVSVGNARYILPLNAIMESLQPKQDMIKMIGSGGNELLMLREEFIPIVRLHKLFQEKPKYTDLTKGMLIVVKSGNHKIALFVDEFLDQHQVVVKPLDKNFRNVQGVGAATVRGDGTIGLILDVMGLIEEQKRREENFRKVS
jgi:two-component system chemotaxis sensor kinase CheA